MPKLDRNAAFNEAFGSEPKLDRAEAEKLAEDGGGLADAGREFVRGTYQLADSTMGMIDRGFVGDLMRAVKGKPTSRDVDPIVTNFLRLPKAEQERISSEYLNAGTPMQDAQAYFKNAADEWAKKRSPSLQAAEDYTQQGDGVVDIVTRYAEEPSALAGALIRNLPQMIPTLLLRKASYTAQANNANIYQGAVGAQQARDQSLTDAEQSGASATDTVNAAQTAEDVGRGVSQFAGLFGARGDVAALNAITGRSLAPVLAGGKKELLKQPALNAVEEFIDEAGSPLGANIGAQKTYDPTRNTMQNVVNQGTHGALVGGPMGIAQGASMAFGKREQTPETAAANADALVSAINNAVGPIVQTRDTLKTQVDDISNQVKAFDEASANGQLNAADIARKQALLQELAAKQTELSTVETQAQDAAIIASNDALKQYAQAGEVPDFNAMGERLGINPDDLSSLYDQHSTSIKQQQAATDTRNKVASLIEANDTEGAQAFLEQNGFKQDQADVIMGDAMKSIAAKNKEANAKKAAEAKQQAKLDAETKLRAERDSELAAILKTKPDASFANDVLPILQKKYKLQSGSEALSVWNEAKKQSKAAPVDQQASLPAADEQTPAIGNTQAIADELAQHIETKTRPDFIGLGKKYSAKPLDLDKQYREMLRVKKEQSKTAPPVAPVQGEAAPIVQPPPKQKAADRPIDPEKDSLLVALAKIGGLSRDEAISHGVDKAMLGHRPIFGKLLFRTDGKSFDSAAEALAQDNYPVFDDGFDRKHTPNALAASLMDALNGNDIGTPQYYVAKAQKAFEEEQEQARIDALFDGKGNSKADWLDEVSDAIVDELIENPSTATQEVIEVIQNDAGTKAQDVTGNSQAETQPTADETSPPVSSREATSQSESGGRESAGSGQEDTGNVGDTKAPTTNGQQIAEALDATATAIGAAAHQSAINRFKKEDGLTYRNPAAIEQVQKDDRYNVEINTDGHAVVKGIKDGDAWVGVAPGTQTELKEAQEIGDAEFDARMKELGYQEQEEIIDHVTAKGKTIRGVVRKGITKEEAKLIDPYTFAKDGGFFLREKYLTQAETVKAETKQEQPQDKPIKNNGIEKEYSKTEKEYSEQPVKQPEQAQDKPIKKDNGPYYSDGYSSFKRGQPRTLPSYFTSETGTNPKNWLKGWDAAKAEQAQNNTPTPVKQPETKQPETKPRDKSAKKLIGKNPEGKDLYEDGRGVRFTDNGRGVQVGEDVAITMQNGKTVYDVSGRTDEHRTVEEVAARQPKEEKPAPIKQPTKKESLLIQIDDELDSALDDLAAIFKEQGKRLSSGVDPVIMGKVLAIGIKASTLYLAKGAVKFSIWAENMIASLSSKGVSQDLVEPYLKGLYLASKAEASPEIRKQMDKEDDVYDFDFATLNVDQQTKGKANELPQLDSTSTKPLEGVSSNDVQGAGSQRSTGGKTSGVGGTNLSGNERTGGAGLSTTRVMGDGTGEVSDAARGKGTEQLAVTPAQDIATDFVITEDDNIGGGGLKTKYRNNVAAIRVLKQVESEGREATNEEQKILAKWVGWGSLYQAFRYTDGSIAKGWDKEVKELAELLTPDEMKAAVDSSVAAHYTSPKIVEAMWKAVQQLGFKGGKVLEPSVGSGNFFGAMPTKLRNSALLHGVELDNITGGIAKLLYPKAKIKAAMGFQDYAIPNGHFDLAIGNPPFGNIKITDKTQRHLDGFTLHNYFFAKSIDALREGGVLAMVVTNRLMDASNANDKARQYIDEHAELLGAIRLPNNAFLKNAGTQVTTDIIFLRKRVAGEDITTNKWMNVRQYKDKNGKTVPLNEYFHAHPEMMLGEFGAYGSMYTPDDPALVARDGQDTLALLNDAIAKLPKSVMPTVEQKSEEMAEKTAQDIPDVKIGSMFVEDGDIYIRQQDSLGERQADVVTLSGKAVDRVKGMISIRDAFILVRDAQLSPNKDSELPSLRKKLNVAYDNFVKTNGFINDDANKRLMRDDPSWPQLSALEEKYDKGLSAAVAKTTGEVARPVSASKAAIFNVRTQFPYATITSVSSAKDGYVESLNRYGKLDIDFVANLYGQSVGDTITELGNLIYQDPVRGWVTSSDYLSGNVKLKLQAAKLSLKAQEAAKGELEALPPIEQLHRGITALEAVIPEDIESVDIDIRAGAHWLPPKHIADFAREMLGINGNVGATYNKFDASWSVDFNQSNISAAKKTEWSTDRRTAAQILNAALNHKQSTVYDKHDDGTTTVNVEATAEANEKVANLKRAWSDWIWHDDNRRVELSRLYNDTFNTDAPTVFDGQHLTLAGKIDDDVLRLRPHQNDGIWRITQSDSTLLDHVVGAGKTFTMIGGAMELRRMGKSNKPMFVVPNHLVGQWAADFIKLYPSANILAATKADFEAKNRKKLFARIATGDWDAVIVAHSSFGKVSLHPDEEAKFIKKEIEEMMEAEALARKEGGEKARNAKDIGKRRLAKEDKLKKLLATKNKDDDNVYWSELGVDSLFVDEAHEFKNLAFTSTIQRVAGLGNQAGSQKATDLFTKIVSLKDRVAGAKVVFATGTPISNTMAEMYTMQRYLDLERMVHQGTVLFDAWARTFGEVVSDWELSPAGKYKMNSRFAKFVNMPELMQGYLSFADVINRDDINRQLAARGETLGTPKIRTGKPQNIVVERSQAQADYIGEATTDSDGNESYPEGSLVYRAENIPKKQEKGADNMLKIMSDARKAALDMRLIDPSLSDSPKSKVNEAIRRILAIYHQWNADKGVQLVFCDLSTPKGAIAQEKARIEELVRLADEGDEAAIKELDEMSPDELDALNSSFSVYDDMKAKLIAQGIPANQVAFIHDAKTDIQKEALFGKVRSGQIRVLIGSTAKMGAGMNVQDRLVALHHLDAPWRPSDLEQREGRIIRQKNEFYKRDPNGFEVDIMRYATKQTLDSRMWQTLEGKARFIEQIRKGDIKSRSVEDIGGEAANAAEMKAASSGNPLILEEMTLRREVQNLEAEKQRHVREQHRLKGTTKKLQEDNEYLEQRVAKMEADVKSKTPEEFEMTVGRKVFKQGEEKARERAGKALSDAAKDIYIKGESRVVGKFGDFDIIARLSLFGSTMFSVEAKSGLNYGEFSFDAENDSLSGLTLKIANAANSVEGLLDRAKATIDSNNKEIPKVEALLSNWKDSTKLDAARKKHTEVIDQLKPKEKAKTEEARAIVNKDAKQNEVTENGNAYEVRQPASPSSRMSQINLFATPLPSPTVIDNQRQAAGNFAVNIESVEQGRIKSVPSKVTDSKGAASILREFGNRAQETFLVLMLDENNKPIEVARHSIGNATSSIVDIALVVGSIASNPKARTVYFGHNHPSGNAEPSQADKNITEKLKEFTDLIGVDFGGHVVMGENGYSLIKDRYDVLENIDYQPATNSRNSVPVTERIITARSKDKPMEASSPQAAESIVEKIDQDGLILLNSQNKVMGFIAITPQEMANLKGNPSLVRSMFSDWSKAGADSTIIVTTSAQNEAADNIARALQSTGTMRVLDHFYKSSVDGTYSSRAQRSSFPPSAGPYFSRRSNINDTDDWSAVPRIQVAKELERLIAQSKDGAIDTEAVESLLDRVKAKQDDKNHNEAMKPRVRGYDWIVERLTRAKRLGELPADMVDMTLWFLAKNPDIANDLGLKLSKEKENQQFDGQYITGSRIMELVKQDTNSPLGAMLQQLSSQDARNEVGVHELLHHTERMLPQNIRDGITKEWANAIIAERKKAAKEIDAAEYARLKNLDDVSPDKETFEATLKDTTWPKAAYYRLRAIDAIIEANAGSTQKLEAMFKDGTFDTKNYHLVNASEFWAVKGASIIAAKYRAKGFVRPVVRWLKGLYQQLRNIFGLSSDVPVMRGLNAVIKGDGQFVTTQMLSSNKGTLQSISASNGQPNPSPTNPKLDRLIHGIGPGEKLFKALSQPIHKWLDTHSSSQWKLVNNMSPAFKQMMREYLRDQKASEEQTKNIVENGIAMSADERILLSDVLEKMVASGTTIPQHIVQVAAAMRSALSGQTDELVRLGMLSEDSAERWRDTYLPRLYDKAAKDPINRALAKRLNVVGDHLKGRGIFREVDENLQAKYERLGWENRAKGKKGHVIMWRDYTPEERIKMGEIRDALHRFATGFLSTQRDIATGRLLEKIADNPDLASVDPVAGWTLVPNATIKETGGVKRYGKLSGMYVHPDVWENTKHYIDDRDGLMEFYRQTLSVWKQGKALALDTPIPTPSGWTTMGEIKEGDIVFDENGNQCDVTYATDVQLNRECYEVEFSDGEKIVADAEHLWLTKFHSKFSVKTTKQILDTLKEKTRGDNNHSIPVAAPLVMKDAVLPMPPYALGAWLGDGNSRNAAINSGSQDAEEMAQLIRDSGLTVGAFTIDKRNGVVTFGIRYKDAGRKRNEGLQPTMRNIGLLMNKHIPDIYLRASVEQRMELLRGLMDTDGGITTSGQCEFSTTSPKILSGIMELLHSLGYKPVAGNQIARINGRDCGTVWRVKFHAYAENPVFKLARKVARLPATPKTNQRSRTRQITGVTLVESVPVKCIQVSSKSSLYLAGKGMIPTHNTALNVVAHMNNVVSNAVMVTAAGANMADVARGYDSIMKEDQYYKEAKELGMLASGHFTGDIRDYFGGDIQDATTPSNLVFKAFKAAWRNKGFEFMRKMYDAEDQLFRMSLYRKARELGATQAESIDYAETFMFNYADLPAGIKKIRDFGLPFISYTYKAVPAVTRLAFTQPHRVLALVGMVYAFNAIAYAMLGADADEDKERKNLPDYMQGYSAWGVPKLVRLPWNDGEKAAFLDIYRWAPLGDFFAIGNRTGGADMPTWAMMSGPYWSFYNTMIQNRNGLTGKNYLEDTDTDRQVFFKRMKFGLSEWVPMYYHLDKNLNAVRNALGDRPSSKLLEGMGYTGTDMRGDPAELKNSLLGATGIKVRKLDMEDQKQRKLISVKSEVLDRKRQINRIRKDQSNPYKERDIAEQVEEIKRLREKAQEIRNQ